MRKMVRASGVYLCMAGLTVLTVAAARSLAAVPSSQPAADAGLYGPAVGKAHYVPEGYKAPAQRLQFVVYGDRNGGELPGFMDQGIALTNLLRPEFILSVGDQIPGYVRAGAGVTTQEAMQKIREQWVEQDAFVSKFQVPYFWTVGNHDMWDKPSGQYYAELHGPRFYSFDAKNVHVIVLNSEEYQEVGGKGMLGETQIAWLKADLEKSKDAGLTVVALHHPVWANKARNDWPAVEALLAARNAIVFAGHYHEYTYEVRSGIPHVIVGPVAGEQRDPNDTLGRLRHVTLVTVEDGKPYVALVKLGSVLPMDAVHWKTQEYVDETCKASRLDYAPEDAQPGQPVSITWTLNNPLNVAMKIEAAWSKDSAWQVEPATASIVLQPKERKQLRFQGRLRLAGAGEPPVVRAKFSWPGTAVQATQMDWPAQALRRLEVPAVKDIQVDGQIDPSWQAISPARLSSVQQFSNGLKDWTGPKDLDVRMRAAADGAKLYLLLEVSDDDIQPSKDNVMIELAATPPQKMADRTFPGMYRFTIRAPKEDGQQEIRWNSKAHLEGEAAARRVQGGWAAEISLDIAPVVKAADVSRSIPFDWMVTDADARQSEPTYVLWSGTREMHDITNAWGVLEMSGHDNNGQ